MSKVFLSGAMGAAAIACGAPDAAAQIYGGVGGSLMVTKPNTAQSTHGSGQVGEVFRVGAKFSPFLSIEGELQNLEPDSYYPGRFQGPDYDIGIKSEYGAFAVGWLPMWEAADLFTRIGAVHTSTITSSSGDIKDGWGFGYGAGVQVGFMAVRLRGEYAHYEVDDIMSHNLTASLLLQF